jgi:hypothetical protein
MRHKAFVLPGNGIPMTPSRDISRLLEIMAALRTPVTGCLSEVQSTFRPSAPMKKPPGGGYRLDYQLLNWGVYD